MSKNHCKSKCSFDQVPGQGKQIHRYLKHFQFTADSRPPAKLSTRELIARREVHWQALSAMCPISVEYERQMTFALLYDALLELRKTKLKKATGRRRHA